VNPSPVDRSSVESFDTERSQKLSGIRFQPDAPYHVIPAVGVMDELMRGRDWTNTPLGPPDSWSPALRMMAKFLLANRFPQLLWWGPQFCSLYNDAYIPILGAKHPWALGQPVSEVWKEIWHVLKPLIETPFHGGPATWMEDLPLEINRRGFLEETHFTVAYSPVPDESVPSGIGGVLATVHEITDQSIGERRVHALRELGAHSTEPKSAEEACELVGKTLSSFTKDIPFLLVYLLDEKQQTATRTCTAGVEPDDRGCPKSIELGSQAEQIWPLYTAHLTEEIQLVENLKGKFDVPPQGPWSDRPNMAAVVPIRSNMQHQLAGFLVAGLSSRIPFDDRYRDFLELLSTQVTTIIANARAYEQERKRSEALAELDQAKTTFFSNISHEFRTPLTLMLGPLHEVLEKYDGLLPTEGKEHLIVAQRNALRLLKLVNTLLDFSRIEAGRMQAVYEPVDLPALTRDLAEIFRSAADEAGIRLVVDCDNLESDNLDGDNVGEQAYVDREMWEKIVLNLLSNALKFTFDGEIRVHLRRVGETVQLSIEDTGIGIAEDHLPHIFERFHRVVNARSRTHEGTGIGLSLIQELAKLHGGELTVESEYGHGSTFRVTIPLGSAHLPPERIGVRYDAAPTPASREIWIDEVQHWMHEEPGNELQQPLNAVEPTGTINAAERETVLLADDNADMRDYLAHLLREKYDVYTVSHGAEAVEAAIKLRPALILSDIMMPELDGFGVLRAIRSDSALHNIPVILLSARAGEESRVEGMIAGADDYLTKPFTARELMARVGAHISMYRLRQEQMRNEQTLRAEAESAERQYRMILESISEGFVFIDRNWRIQYANEQWASVAGVRLSEVMGNDLWQMFPGLEKTAFGQGYLQAMETQNLERVEEHYAPLGRWFHVNIYPSSEGISIFVQDVTERRMQQERLLLSEKLAATGRLAATIAHEINNPLESVLNLIYLARTSRGQTEKIEEFLSTAENEVTRVSHIARHTLGFYRESSVPALIDMGSLLDEVLTVYQSKLQAAGIEVRKDFADVPTIKALRGEMHQIFSNLLSNAIDAMREGGKLSIAVRDAEEDGHTGVEVRIEDSGIGIPPENLPKLFDAFFTTKPSSGTGLGLWVVKQFIDSWGGSICATSSTDAGLHGTAFTLFLPLVAVSQSAHLNGTTKAVA
jgi:PAS domain S-box-containing protein